MFGCLVHDLRNVRASFRGLHPGTDRRRSRLPHGNWPLTPRIITQGTCVKGNVMFFDRGPDSETPRHKTEWVYALREKGEVVALRTLFCTVLCTRSNLSFARPPALLHSQRGIARNTFQTRRDVRCSLSGGERDAATSYCGNRRIRRGPLDVRRRDLRSRIAEGHCGYKGLLQAEQNSAIGGRAPHTLPRVGGAARSHRPPY